MSTTEYGSQLSNRVRDFVRTGFTPHYGQLKGHFLSKRLWCRLRELGTELWLDTGDIDAIARLWTEEFTGLTTNNTLLNREVQKGIYDDLVVRAAAMLDDYGDLTEADRRLELAFILNAHHGLRLVEMFDAFVSVEEHTDLAHDVEASVNYARRYHEICPERFYVKIPLTPAGILATRRVSDEGISVNHTLGFSARQNYVIARLASPAFVNVFMGRLNSFVADNELGPGTYIGQRTTLASQRRLGRLRQEYNLPCRQIGASLRSGHQVADLAGMDVMTLPPKVAKEFLDLGIAPLTLADRTGEQYELKLNANVDPEVVALNTLWDVDETLIACVDALGQEDLTAFTSDALVDFFHGHGCRDLFVRWSDLELATSVEEGKVPQLGHWRRALSEGRVGLDSVLNLGGLNSFAADQRAMDHRVSEVLARADNRH